MVERRVRMPGDETAQGRMENDRANISPYFAIAAVVSVLCLIAAGGIYHYRWERSPEGRSEMFVLQCGDSMSGVSLRESQQAGKIKCRAKHDALMAKQFGDGDFYVCLADTDMGLVGYVCDRDGCTWSIRNGVEP